MVYSADQSKVVVPVLVLLFVVLWFILWGDLFYVLTLCYLFLCFSVLLALRLPRLGKRKLILVLFVRLFDLCLFGLFGFLFLLVSGKGCGLWLDFSLTCFENKHLPKGRGDLINVWRINIYPGGVTYRLDFPQERVHIDWNGGEDLI